jgi:hypothetical protein
MKAVDTGPFRAVALGVPQPAVAEFPPAVAEPQRRGSGESVTAPGTQVTVDRSAGTRPERHPAGLAALAR